MANHSRHIENIEKHVVKNFNYCPTKKIIYVTECGYVVSQKIYAINSFNKLKIMVNHNMHIENIEKSAVKILTTVRQKK